MKPRQEGTFQKLRFVPEIEDQQKPAETVKDYISFNYIFQDAPKSSYALQPQVQTVGFLC